MKKIIFIVLALSLSLASCSKDDNSNEETCVEYNSRWEKKFAAASPEDAIELFFEYALNLPEGCQAIEE